LKTIVLEYDRVVCWFSAGVTSTVATKLTLDKYKGGLPVDIVYTDTGSEHPDTERYIQDCEKFFGQNVIVLKSNKYSDIWDVFNKTKYLVGPNGARCTTELKKVLRFEYQRSRDLQIFGFDKNEKHRIERIQHNNFDANFSFPLLENNLTKKDCIKIVQDEYKLILPEMYRLGFSNNNCVGCVKGGMGYWQHIRKVFPFVYARMAKVERKINISILRRDTGKKDSEGERIYERIFLDELKVGRGRPLKPFVESCGMFCGE